MNGFLDSPHCFILNHTEDQLSMNTAHYSSLKRTSRCYSCPIQYRRKAKPRESKQFVHGHIAAKRAVVSLQNALYIKWEKAEGKSQSLFSKNT